jgi:hypothetical protein
MSTLSLRIPASLHQELRALARREGVSINQIVSAAVGEKLASLKTVEYLRERASRGNRMRFEEVLAKVPDIDPEDFDAFPQVASRQTSARPRKGRRS